MIGCLIYQQDNRLDLAMMSLKVNYVQLCLFWAYFIYYCEDGHWPPPFKIKIHQGGGPSRPGRVRENEP